MKRMRVYLCGPIVEGEDTSPDWREQAVNLSASRSAVNMLCPIPFTRSVDTDFPGWRDTKSLSNTTYVDCMRKVIRRSLNALSSCDVLLVYWDGKVTESMNVPVEVSTAFMAGLPVVAVVPGMGADDTLEEEPDWLLACARFFAPNIEKALDHIQEMGQLAPDPKRDKVNLDPRSKSTI
jgi:hypothetical protein